MPGPQSDWLGPAAIAQRRKFLGGYYGIKGMAGPFQVWPCAMIYHVYQCAALGFSKKFRRSKIGEPKSRGCKRCSGGAPPTRGVSRLLTHSSANLASDVSRRPEVLIEAGR